MKRLKKFWEDLYVDIVVNKRELVLGMALCAVSGLALGMLCSPRKQVTIGSHNSGNGCYNNAQAKAGKAASPKG